MGCAVEVTGPNDTGELPAELATDLDEPGHQPVETELTPALNALAAEQRACSGPESLSEDRIDALASARPIRELMDDVASGTLSEAATAAACVTGENTCYNFRCFACCNGSWYDINECLYGVHFYCGGGGPYNAYNCWPYSVQDDDEEADI